MTPEQQAILKIIAVIAELSKRLARETGTNTATWAADTLNEAWELIDTIPGRPTPREKMFDGHIDDFGSLSLVMTDREMEVAIQLIRDGYPAREAMRTAVTTIDPRRECCHSCEAEWVNEGDKSFVEQISRFMIVCNECGDKRCGRAEDHRFTCTDPKGTLDKRTKI